MDEINMEGLELPELPDLPDLPDISGISDFGKTEDTVKAAEEKVTEAATAASDTVKAAEEKVADTVKNAEETIKSVETKVEDTVGAVEEKILTADEKAAEAAKIVDDVAESVQQVDDYDLESIDASSLISDMDGNSIDAVADMGNFHPEKLYVAKENRYHSMQAEAEKKAEEERRAAQQSYMEQNQSTKRYSSADYANDRVGSYRYNEKTGENKSLESLYEHQFDMDPEIAEKGRKKAQLISTVGYIVYGIGAVTALLSMFSGDFFAVIDLIFNAFVLFFLYRFNSGSRKARDILGWLAVIKLVFAIRGFAYAIGGGAILSMLPGIGWLLGVLVVLENIVTVIVSGWMAFMFFADDDIAEYTKTMRDGGFDLFKF